MILTEPLNINFHIPASDPLGKDEVEGKLRFLPDEVELFWRLKGNVFVGGKGEMTKISLPYPEIEHVELVKKWFRFRQIIFRVSDPSLVRDIPGVDMGKMILHLDSRSSLEAKKLTSLVDFQKSTFILDAHQRRLDAMRLGE